MKASTYRAIQIVLFTVLFAFIIFCVLLASGCASSSALPTFQAPETVPVPFPIPVPPAERACNPAPPLQVGLVTQEAVEADGSVQVQALTADIFNLSDLIIQNYNECVASNEARQIIIKAAKEAQAELERILAEAQ